MASQNTKRQPGSESDTTGHLLGQNMMERHSIADECPNSMSQHNITKEVSGIAQMELRLSHVLRTMTREY